MEAKPMDEVIDVYGPEPDDDHSVAVVLYDKFKAPTDSDYITCPYRLEYLDDLPPLPEQKSGYEYTILHEDGRRWEYQHLLQQDDPPDWFPENWVGVVDRY